MSAVVRYDDDGVLLRYSSPDKAAPHHISQKPQVSDRERVLFVRAEHALDLLVTVIECLQLDDVVRIDRAIDVICSALDVKRERLGLSVTKSAGTL